MWKLDYFRQNPGDRSKLMSDYKKNQREKLQAIRDRQVGQQYTAAEKRQLLDQRRTTKAGQRQKVKRAKEKMLQAEMEKKIQFARQRQQRHQNGTCVATQRAWLVLAMLGGPRLQALRKALIERRAQLKLDNAATTLARFQRKCGEKEKGRMYRLSIGIVRSFVVKNAASVKRKKKARCANILTKFLRDFQDQDFMKVMRYAQIQIQHTSGMPASLPGFERSWLMQTPFPFVDPSQFILQPCKALPAGLSMHTHTHYMYI
jgi:hypothetical protein